MEVSIHLCRSPESGLSVQLHHPSSLHWPYGTLDEAEGAGAAACLGTSPGTVGLCLPRRVPAWSLRSLCRQPGTAVEGRWSQSGGELGGLKPFTSYLWLGKCQTTSRFPLFLDSLEKNPPKSKHNPNVTWKKELKSSLISIITSYAQNNMVNEELYWARVSRQQGDLFSTKAQSDPLAAKATSFWESKQPVSFSLGVFAAIHILVPQITNKIFVREFSGAKTSLWRQQQQLPPTTLLS